MKLYLDANVIIYAYEATEPLRSVLLQRLFHWCSELKGELITSTLSRLECRVAPLRVGNQALLTEYDIFFGPDGVELVEISLAVIDRATALRAHFNFKTPDAIHLASAIHSGADVFLTADTALARCKDISVEVLQI